jgi:hypothetical protein
LVGGRRLKHVYEKFSGDSKCPNVNPVALRSGSMPLLLKVVRT